MAEITPFFFEAVLGALVVGVVAGWVGARRQGKRELEAYRKGVIDAQGGPCWVKSQIPPN